MNAIFGLGRPPRQGSREIVTAVNEKLRTMPGGRQLNPNITDDEINIFDDNAFGFKKDTFSQPHLRRYYKRNKVDVIADMTNHYDIPSINRLFLRGPDRLDESMMLPNAALKHEVDKYFENKPIHSWTDREGRPLRMIYKPRIEFTEELMEKGFDAGVQFNNDTARLIHKKKGDIARDIQVLRGRDPRTDVFDQVLFSNIDKVVDDIVDVTSKQQGADEVSSFPAPRA